MMQRIVDRHNDAAEPSVVAPGLPADSGFNFPLPPLPDDGADEKRADAPVFPGGAAPPPPPPPGPPGGGPPPPGPPGRRKGFGDDDDAQRPLSRQQNIAARRRSRAARAAAQRTDQAELQSRQRQIEQGQFDIDQGRRLDDIRTRNIQGLKSERDIIQRERDNLRSERDIAIGQRDRVLGLGQQAALDAHQQQLMHAQRYTDLSKRLAQKKRKTIPGAKLDAHKDKDPPTPKIDAFKGAHIAPPTKPLPKPPKIDAHKDKDLPSPTKPPLRIEGSKDRNVISYQGMKKMYGKEGRHFYPVDDDTEMKDVDTKKQPKKLTPVQRAVSAPAAPQPKQVRFAPSHGGRPIIVQGHAGAAAGGGVKLLLGQRRRDPLRAGARAAEGRAQEEGDQEEANRRHRGEEELHGRAQEEDGRAAGCQGAQDPRV